MICYKPAVRRSPGNPILTREQIPDVPPGLVDVTSVFNPGAIKLGDEYVLLLRVQTRGRRTVLMVARSHAGEAFTVELAIDGIDDVGEEVFHVYDPRLTEIGGVIHIVFAADVPGACRLGVAKTDASFERIELVSFDSSRDSRNGVLFPDMPWLLKPSQMVKYDQEVIGNYLEEIAHGALR